MLILVLNCGSSSVKYQLYDMPSEKCLAGGSLEKIGKKIPNHAKAVKLIITQRLKKQCAAVSCTGRISAVGHRVVHGGERLNKSMRINSKVLSKIKGYSKLAPLHNPPNLAGIYAVGRMFSRMPQVAVFDTAFHQTIPPHAYLYALDYHLYERQRIRRYGFHGTSHRYVSRRAAELLDKSPEGVNLITCHLGNGCSMTAIKNGMSVDTSMGMTPLEGLVMGTRCGDIDPAIIFQLAKGIELNQIDTMLNKKSGLLGISGISNDVRDIRKAADSGNKQAELALEIFCYRIKKYIGAYLAILGKVGGIIFTGGIGENDSAIRNSVCEGLAPLGIKLDPGRNREVVGTEGLISADNSGIKILVIPTNEEKMIAMDTYEEIRRSQN